MFNPVTILINYLVVQTAIAAFIAPFYFLYKKSIKIKYADFSQEVEQFFESKQANYLVFFWAVGEALVWFVIPEFLLLLMIYMRVKRTNQLLYYDIFGTIVGSLIAIIFHFPQKLLLAIPYIQPSMIEQTRFWYNNHGILGIFFQPFSGVPYKVFANLAPDFHFFIPLFLILAVVVRVSRYFIVFFILKSMQPSLHKIVQRNYIKLFLAATFIFSTLLLRVYLNYGAQYQVK